MGGKNNDGRSFSHDILENYRFRSIELRKNGWKVKDIAESFGIHQGSVSRWLTKHRRKGEKALLQTKALGPQRKLTPKEIQKLISYLKKPATDFDFETPLWNTTRIKQLIKKKLDKNLHQSNVWRLLKACGFSPQVPERKASQQDEKAVERWLSEEWPNIVKQAKRWQAIIYFLDECGVSLIPVLGRTWAPKGKTPILEVTGKKGGLCVTSAISPSGKMVFRIEKERIDAERHIEFLEQIIKHHARRKIIVIEDKARPHIAKLVSQFAEKNKKRFSLYFIPSYSPELNPDEHTWRHLKQHELKSHQAQDQKDLRALVLSKMRSMQKRTDLVKSFFNKNDIT